MLLNSSYCQLCNKYLNFCQANPNLAKLGSIIPVRNRIYMFSHLYVFVCVFQITRLWNWILTQITFKGFHSCMCSFMFFQIARLWKWLLTEITFKNVYSSKIVKITSHTNHIYMFLLLYVLVCVFQITRFWKMHSHTNHI